jgi:putative Holliday junction resolvase
LRILGLDVGTKYIGVALSDEMGWTAQALTTIERKGLQQDIAAIQILVADHEVEEVVIGLPITMDGEVGIQAKKVLDFSQKLQQALIIPVFHWDERLSTKAATKTLLKADMSRKKRKKVIDKMAAAFILQGYIDRKAWDKAKNREGGNGSH